MAEGIQGAGRNGNHQQQLEQHHIPLLHNFDIEMISLHSLALKTKPYVIGKQ